MNVSKELVTPKKAMEWLRRNIANRPLSAKVTSKYAAVMKIGRWKLNGETIKFNTNGDLIDGQHRLAACVESGVPFECYIVRGLLQDAFDTIDGGKPRSGADVLARRGEKHYSMLSAAIGMYYQLTTTGAISSSAAVRIDQISDCLEQNPGLRQACDFSCEHRNTGIVATSIVAALLHAFETVDEAKAKLFWSRVLIGEDLRKEMIEFKLRTKLLENVRSAAKLRRDGLCALAIKAWNFYYSGTNTQILKWAMDEEFPKIKGFKYLT